MKLEIGWIGEVYFTAKEQNKAWAALDPKDERLYPQHSKPRRKRNYDEEQAEYSRILFNLNNKFVFENQYKTILTSEGEKAKLQQMKQWLYEWSDGKLDEQYWKDLQEGKVDEKYWEQGKR